MSVSPMHTNGMLQAGKSEDMEARDITFKDSPRKLTLPSLPAELRAMIYQTVFEDCIVQIDDSGIGFIHDHYMIDFNCRKSFCRRVLGGYDDGMIASLAMYRIADPIMLPLWLARQPEYRMVIRRLSVHITHLWVGNNHLYGYQANNQPFSMHLPFWLGAENMPLKPILPRLKEMDVLIHCTTMSFVGLWIKGRLPTASCHAMMATWKEELVIWNPGLTVVLRCLAPEHDRHTR
ncbi:hypothetical protein BM1_01290 [Bipolaris maydis]|nr:hypothetical protein BM1_01290 [Bipolaris maydis]